MSERVLPVVITQTHIFYFFDLEKEDEEKRFRFDDLFSESDIQWMYGELLPLTMKDEGLKTRHIDNISNY